MKHIHKLLFLFILAVCSCQVEQLGQNNVTEENFSEQAQQNSENNACQTLFATGNDDQSTCFIEDGFNRWGWTIGSLGTGEYSYDLYSGAGQCVLENGTMVGSLSVNYDEALGTADVTFNMQVGFVLNETHLYIGNEPYPRKPNGQFTVAPGQFPYQRELDGADSDTYTIDALSGEIYVIAHGVVCDDDNDDGDDGDGGPF